MARFSRFTATLIVALVSLVFLFPATILFAHDRHAGYYYPAPQTTELYETRIDKIPDASRTGRIAFVVGLNKQAQQAPYAPRYAVFAKGEDAEKLIVIAQDDDLLNSLYRMRALLAQMTAIARVTPVFQEIDREHMLTFLDMLFLMGFTQITLSDGLAVSHQIMLR